MRVLHVLNSLRGGATVSALELIRTGRRIGSGNSHYVVYPGRFGERSTALEGIATDCSGVPLRTWNLPALPPTLRGRLIRRWREGWTALGPGTDAALARLVDRWRIEVIHTNTVILDGPARYAARSGVPHAWHIRERVGEDGFMRFAEPPGVVARTIAELSGTVPVISEYVRDVFVRAGVGGSTRLVYDGLDPRAVRDPEAPARADALRRRWGIPDQAPVIGMVGGLAAPVKRHDVFLRAAACVPRRGPEPWLLIAGVTPAARSRVRTGEDAYAEQVLRLVGELGLAARTVFTGFVDDMAAVWSLMDVYVHACEVEGFSRAVLEAMAAGVPVVAVAAGGNPEAVRDEHTGLLFPAGDDQACADAVARLLADPRLGRELGEHAAREVSERYSPESHYRMMETVLAETRAGTEEVL